MPKSTERSLSQNGWCNKPTKLQFFINFNTENVEALRVSLQIAHRFSILTV